MNHKYIIFSIVIFLLSSLSLYGVTFDVNKSIDLQRGLLVTNVDPTTSGQLIHSGNASVSGRLSQGHVVFADGDTTPSVASGSTFYCAYSTAAGGILITDFDDGVDGQVITVMIDAPADGSVTFTRNNSYLEGGAALVVAANTLGTITLILRGTLWWEVSRANPVN